MSGNDVAPPSPSTTFGRAMMLQALSAMIIIGGLLVLWTPEGILNLHMLVVGILYAIGFIQIFLVRYVLQGGHNGAIASLIVALAAILFTFILVAFWVETPESAGKGFFFFTSMFVNFGLAGMLHNILLQKT